MGRSENVSSHQSAPLAFSCCQSAETPQPPPHPLQFSPCTLWLCHLAFFPQASLSESADATEKRAEVNSLSLCLINNVSQRLTEPVWMADGIIWPEPFLYDCCTFASWRDLFNLGDKLLFDLAAVFIFCFLMCRRDAFSHCLPVSPWLFKLS